MRGIQEVRVAAALRTPLGRRGGSLAGEHPASLMAIVLEEVLVRTGIDPGAVDEVIVGAVDQVGEQAGNIARTALLAAGLPESVPGVTVDRQCGSSLQALQFGAHMIAAGEGDLVIVGGVESMSRVPLLASTDPALGLGTPLDLDRWRARYGEQEISQFRGAELLVEQWQLDRADLDGLALESHRRAAAATAAGRFADHLVPVAGLTGDEGIRSGATAAALAALSPLPGRATVTAGQCSQVSDGAAAVLLCSPAAQRRWGLPDLGRIVAATTGGSSPVTMLDGTIPATQKVLHRAGLSLDDIDLFEVNEAFAAAVLAWARGTGADLDRTNVNGGAIALGHPLGASGARIFADLVHELARRDARYGLETICEWGGTANAVVVERPR